MKYDIVSRDKYFLVTTSGLADPGVYEEALDSILNHPDWRPGHSYIFDHSSLDASKMTKVDVERLADIARKRRTKYRVGKSAIVAPDDVAFGFGRMVIVYAEDESKIPANIFRTLEEAVAWIVDE